MPAEKIKQLEELVSSVLQSLDNFYSENSRLEQRIQVLEKEKAASSKENDRAKDLLEKMKKLEACLIMTRAYYSLHEDEFKKYLENHPSTVGIKKKTESTEEPSKEDKDEIR